MGICLPRGKRGALCRNRRGRVGLARKGTGTSQRKVENTDELGRRGARRRLVASASRCPEKTECLGLFRHARQRGGMVSRRIRAVSRGLQESCGKSDAMGRNRMRNICPARSLPRRPRATRNGGMSVGGALWAAGQPWRGPLRLPSCGERELAVSRQNKGARPSS